MPSKRESRKAQNQRRRNHRHRMFNTKSQHGTGTANTLFLRGPHWVRPRKKEKRMADKMNEEIAKMIADGIAQAMAGLNATKKGKKKAGAKTKTDAEKTANRAKIEAETVKNFKDAGYKDVQPRVNVMTYLKWVENGRRVKKGEKSIKCGSFPL